MIVQSARIETKWLDLEYQEVTHRGRPLRYASTGSSSVKRVRTLFSKEPSTLAWIDRFGQGDTLFDIGANVGMYTIYAAVMRGCQVYAFEPEALNYAELNKNIYLNNLHGQVLAYGLAISDVDKLDRLLLSDFGYGISFHDFEENSWTGDKAFAHDWVVKKDERRPQGCIGRQVDTLIAEGLPVPKHIKIDVDGLENRVIGGMRQTLMNPSVETVLIEVNFDDPRNLALINEVCSLGWRYSMDQIRCNRKTKFTDAQILKYQREGKGGLNYIFYRDDVWEDFWSGFCERYVPGVVESYIEL